MVAGRLGPPAGNGGRGPCHGAGRASAREFSWSLRMPVRFQKSESGHPMLFMEKHVRTIAMDATVQSFIDLEAKGRGSRNFAGSSKVDVNTLLCMTPGQQQS